MTQPAPRPSNTRVHLILAVVAVLFVLSYTLLFVAISRSAHPTETTFDSSGKGVPLAVYAEIQSIGAVRETMQIKFTFASERGQHGLRFSGMANRDILVDVSDGDVEKQYQYFSGKPIDALDVPAGVDGSVGSYPIDRYSTSLFVHAYEGRRADPARAIPLHLTVWEGLDDWEAVTRNVPEPSGLHVELSVHRSPPIVFFGIVVYTVMALLAVAALAIGTLVFTHRRKVEMTLTGALVAMIFALPAMRGVLPGAPPLGVAADVLVFLWAEIAVAAGLVLFVWRWARGNSRVL